jgi:hypothetical protein
MSILLKLILRFGKLLLVCSRVMEYVNRTVAGENQTLFYRLSKNPGNEHYHKDYQVTVPV